MRRRRRGLLRIDRLLERRLVVPLKALGAGVVRWPCRRRLQPQPARLGKAAGVEAPLVRTLDSGALAL